MQANSNTPNHFYTDFEAKFRGSRSMIKKRLEIYIPILELLNKHFELPSALDLGCGRGEWLELLQSHEFPARGVDLDAGQLQSCDKYGLKTLQGNAIQALHDLTEKSESIISAFHLVEHLCFEDLQRLIKEAQRVLRPGGILIIETPNPENLNVGCNDFYTDPTHLRPIPPPLLQFLFEQAGIKDSHILRLQHKTELEKSTKIRLSDVLLGVSPDYAIIGINPGNPSITEDIKKLASKHSGLTLEDLCRRFDEEHKNQDHQYKDYNSDLENLRQFKAQFSAKKDEENHTIQELEDQLNQQTHNLNVVLNSTSWRITKPLRLILDFLKNINPKKLKARSLNYPKKKHAGKKTPYFYQPDSQTYRFNDEKIYKNIQDDINHKP